MVLAVCKSFCTIGKNFGKGLFLTTRHFTTMSQLLDMVSDVDIDSSGKFKYILINVRDKKSSTDKLVVRGYARAQWHADIYDEICAQLQQYGSELTSKCVGGGRIENDSSEKRIKVYGYSQGFGKADHEITVKLLKKKYPDYVITCSDEGY